MLEAVLVSDEVRTGGTTCDGSRTAGGDEVSAGVVTGAATIGICSSKGDGDTTTGVAGDIATEGTRQVAWFGVPRREVLDCTREVEADLESLFCKNSLENSEKAENVPLQDEEEYNSLGLAYGKIVLSNTTWRERYTLLDGG